MEQDPNGLNQHAAGAKLDKGKPTFAMSLGYFKDAIAAVDEVSHFGANKYSHGGWRHVDDGIRRYTEAGIRHLLAELYGETYDPETDLLHAAQHAWNALARLQLIIEAHNATPKGDTECFKQVPTETT